MPAAALPAPRHRLAGPRRSKGVDLDGPTAARAGPGLDDSPTAAHRGSRLGCPARAARLPSSGVWRPVVRGVWRPVVQEGPFGAGRGYFGDAAARRQFVGLLTSFTRFRFCL